MEEKSRQWGAGSIAFPVNSMAAVRPSFFFSPQPSNGCSRSPGGCCPGRRTVMAAVVEPECRCAEGEYDASEVQMVFCLHSPT